MTEARCGWRAFDEQHTIEDVLFVEEGHVEVRLGAERRVVTPRAIVFIPAGVAHGFRNVGESVACIRAVFPGGEITVRYLERNPAPGTEGDDPQPPVAFDVRERITCAQSRNDAARSTSEPLEETT